MKKKFRLKRFSVSAGRFRLNLGSRTLIMGIINLTRDSFSQDGLLKKNNNRSLAVKGAFSLAKRMESEGADIIDIGAESTRPGAIAISAEEEIKRVVPVVKKISRYLSLPISVDTYKPEVALAAIEAGASIINNIFGTHLEYNEKIAKICAKKNRALVMMHIRGTPQDMHQHTKYQNLISEIKSDLRKALIGALNAGLDFENIIVDPGIGFAKTYLQNLEIIKRLDEFALLGRPLLIGVSRKSFIGKVLNLDVDKREFGTAALVALSIAAGAHIVRVHDVSKMYQVVRISDAVLNYKNFYKI